nr:homoserine O-succinyltransferase [Marinicella sp. W31]MDC2878833.1 homoserine O-succinyltransferase [Marinicella sp. W31]
MPLDNEYLLGRDGRCLSFPRHPQEASGKKAFGVHRHRNLKPASVYLNGFSDDFQIPVSRWTEVRREDLERVAGMELLMDSDEVGPCLAQESFANRLYMFNHIEYDSGSLADEYMRDVEANVPVDLPFNYFPADDPNRTPLNRWRSHAHLLFGNWINEVYQTTPYSLEEIGKKRLSA